MSCDSSDSGTVPGGAVRRTRVLTVGEGVEKQEDRLAAEEPMEIRVIAEEAGRRRSHQLAVTMRTPGNDFELAAGFLFTETVISGGSDLWRLARCEESETAARNVVEAHLAPDVVYDAERFRRNFYATSSCGVCGKASLELLEVACPSRPSGDFRVAPRILMDLPRLLGERQRVFSQTGGLHACGLFGPDGRLLRLREDVGRHNALDKLVGSFVLEEATPLADTLLLVSGRASFELVQKAVVAGIPMLCAVGAPSSLAVETAEAYGQTLIGFLSDRRFNVYCGERRVRL